MFEALKKYAKLHPLSTIAYTVGGTVAGTNLVDIILSHGEVDTHNLVLLGITGLNVIGAKIASKYEERAYNLTCQHIEEHGFTPGLFEYEATRRLAEFFADENNRVDEYQNALKEYQPL